MIRDLPKRINISCVIPHLDRAETGYYIASHLDYAEGRIDIFTDKAVDEIFKENVNKQNSMQNQSKIENGTRIKHS